MGLGKTFTSILACDMVGATRVAVLCPASVRPVWRKHFETCSLLDPQRLIFSYNEVVSNPDKRYEIMDLAPDVLILDECHYLKSPRSKRTRIAYDQLSPVASRVWGLSGTAAKKDPTDLWTHCRHLGGEKKGYMEWAAYYCNIGPSEYAPFRVFGLKRDRIPELRASLACWYLRRGLADVALDLPSIRWGDLPIESEKALQMLRMFILNHAKEGAGLQQLEHILRTGTDNEVMEALERSPYTATIQRLTALAKLPALLEEIDRQMEDGLEKVVLFAYHREVLHELERHFSKGKVGAVSLHGGTPNTQREIAVRDFQDRTSCRVFIGQIQAAGTGLTLTAAHNAIFVESCWDPSDMNQAAKRIHRIGQEYPCLIQTASLVGSFDETVNRVVTRRARTIYELEDK
jgi:SWI/SNF-related matrix-associated actin-dependent regulator 1 of chromatin subfamily A